VGEGDTGSEFRALYLLGGTLPFESCLFPLVHLKARIPTAKLIQLEFINLPQIICCNRCQENSEVIFIHIGHHFHLQIQLDSKR
jgi:hypothetical protein